MTKLFCDRCGFEIKYHEPRHGIEIPAFREGEESAVSSKDVCASCWKHWQSIVHQFLQKQGQ